VKVDIPAGTLVASRYRIVRELGRGGMGAVYLAEHINTGDHVALKVLIGTGAVDPETLERFKREARAPAKIKSEHVVRVLDADTAPELGYSPFLVMELLQGNDLQKIVRQRGRLGPDEVASHLEQAARALDKSHALGIVHRDLKPENIFLHQREDGTVMVKVLDFGISKILPQAAASAMPMTQLGSVMGTPLFMSPEQARGAVQVIGPQTDVWAIGLIAVHLLTGEHYWGTPKTLTELMTLIIRCELYPPTQRWPWLPPLFDQWFYRSCAREPTQRFSSAGEQVAQLAIALGASIPGSQRAAPTMTDPMGATAAAPPTVPQPMSHQPASYQPYAMAPPPVPQTAPMLVGGSTTAAGAMSRQPDAVLAPEPGGFSAGKALAIAAGLFVLVAGLGLGAIAIVKSKSTPQAATTAQPTATAVETVEPTADPIPTLHVPTATTTPAANPSPHPRPTATISARTSATAPNPAPTPTTGPGGRPKDHKACIDWCINGCKNDSDPMECAKACSFDCP
jgi:serine/threonine-protein kinase